MDKLDFDSFRLALTTPETRAAAGIRLGQDEAAALFADTRRAVNYWKSWVPDKTFPPAQVRHTKPSSARRRARSKFWASLSLVIAGLLIVAGLVVVVALSADVELFPGDFQPNPDYTVPDVTGH